MRPWTRNANVSQARHLYFLYFFLGGGSQVIENPTHTGFKKEKMELFGLSN
jgi:hypothetical protein